jgi:hypothetical protein
MWEVTNARRSLIGKLVEKSELGRYRRRWVDNIQMDLKDIEVGF